MNTLQFKTKDDKTRFVKCMSSTMYKNMKSYNKASQNTSKNCILFFAISIITLLLAILGLTFEF